MFLEKKSNIALLPMNYDLISSQSPERRYLLVGGSKSHTKYGIQSSHIRFEPTTSVILRSWLIIPERS